MSKKTQWFIATLIILIVSTTSYFIPYIQSGDYVSWGLGKVVWGLLTLGYMVFCWHNCDKEHTG